MKRLEIISQIFEELQEGGLPIEMLLSLNAWSMSDCKDRNATLMLPYQNNNSTICCFLLHQGFETFNNFVQISRIAIEIFNPYSVTIKKKKKNTLPTKNTFPDLIQQFLKLYA